MRRRSFMTTSALRGVLAFALFASAGAFFVPTATAEPTDPPSPATAADAEVLDMIASLPPGDIKGKVTESDGVTPNAQMKVVLKNATTGDDLISVTTNDKGEYVFENVKEGVYIVKVGSGGFSAMLMVVAGSETGSLDIMIPNAISLAAIGTAVAESPVLSPIFLGGGILLVAAPIIANNADWHSHKRTVIDSPTSP